MSIGTEALIFGSIELAKAALQMYFAYAQQAGLDEDEIEALYISTKAGMASRPADDLNVV